MAYCYPSFISTPSLEMSSQVPVSLPKSMVLKLLKPSYLS